MISVDVPSPFSAPVYFCRECGSTMDEARSLAFNISPSGTVIAAGLQKSGHGREANRRWISEAGKNLLFTVILRFNDFSDIPECLTLKAGLAVYKAIAEEEPVLEEKLSIKWPNDIMIGNKKTAGIIAECDGKNVFIGIGINVAQQDFSGLPAATSIINALNEAGACPSDAGLAYKTPAQGGRYADALPRKHSALLSKVLFELDGILREKSQTYLDPLNRCLYMKNKAVTFLAGTTEHNTQIKGILSGINKKGELLITVCENEAPLSFVTGELKYIYQN